MQEKEPQKQDKVEMTREEFIVEIQHGLDFHAGQLQHLQSMIRNIFLCEELDYKMKFYMDGINLTFTGRAKEKAGFQGTLKEKDEGARY